MSEKRKVERRGEKCERFEGGSKDICLGGPIRGNGRGVGAAFERKQKHHTAVRDFQDRFCCAIGVPAPAAISVS